MLKYFYEHSNGLCLIVIKKHRVMLKYFQEHSNELCLIVIKSTVLCLSIFRFDGLYMMKQKFFIAFIIQYRLELQKTYSQGQLKSLLFGIVEASSCSFCYLKSFSSVGLLKVQDLWHQHPTPFCSKLRKHLVQFLKCQQIQSSELDLKLIMKSTYCLDISVALDGTLFSAYSTTLGMYGILFRSILKIEQNQ